MYLSLSLITITPPINIFELGASGLAGGLAVLLAHIDYIPLVPVLPAVPLSTLLMLMLDRASRGDKLLVLRQQSEP